MADEEHAHEIFIIKRHGGHDEGHHGGVWKIAFADFMTAMMAFFLVMWLISANDKTKATIASYFNPVKLVDTTTQPKGLEDAKAVESVEAAKKAAKPTPVESLLAKETAIAAPESAAKAEAAQADNASKSENAAKAGGSEQAATKAKEKHLATAVIEDPYAALTEIAGTKGAGEKSAATTSASSTSVKTTPNAISRKGGDAFRDPFAPPPPLQPDLQVPPSDTPEVDAKAKPAGTEDSTTPDAKRNSGKDGTSGKETAAAMASPDPSKAGSAQAAKVQAANQQSADLKAQITAAAKATGLDKAGPQIDVRKADGGILISLTDSEQFEMFSSGSAVPGRQVVLMMDKIAQILKAKPGKIIIRGFTDGRPYKSGHYDNWRLSLDRAQVMHYMLVRGGFDESRIANIEGYADRNLKNTADPTSAVNRRIEILLKEDAQ